MFRDKDEQLQRLQEALLEEEQTAQLPEEEDFEALLWETDQGETPTVYQNYSNDYGRNLRNFASGYKAYNSDDTDVELEEYCDQVQQEPTTTNWWIWLVLLLMAAVVISIGWMFLSTGGLG